MKFAVTLLLISMTGTLAHSEDLTDLANSHTYSFGGACSSQGNWTQDALAGTQGLLVVAEQLKNDPRCGNLSKAMAQHLANLKAEVGTIDANSASANKLSSLKEETLALRNFLSGDASLKKNIIELILNNTVESAITSTDMYRAGAGNTAKSLLSVGKRINRASTASLDILNSVMDAALQEHQCLSSPDTMGPLMTGMIQVIGAFGGSGQDSYGSKLATLVNKISKIMRDAKYANVMKQLNQTQLRNSMSCLLEITSDSYCSALDASNLFKEQMSRFEIAGDKDDSLKLKETTDAKTGNKGPLLGYYILTQQIPVITSWLEKVQRGVEPKLKTDAKFKNDTLQTVNDFYITENDLLGDINSSKTTLASQTSLQAKKNMVLKTLLTLSAKLGGGNPDSNFFTINMRPMEIPFALIGREVPPEVLGKGKSDIMQSPQDWLQANMPNLSEFEKPEQLLETIHGNLKSLIESAQTSAVSYYNEWFIYDNAALYVDSVTGMRYNVRDSLKSTHDYLVALQEKLKSSTGVDASILPTIDETLYLISTVLEKYEKIRLLGETYKAAAKDRDRKATIDEGKKLHKELVEYVYTQFSVLKGKSGFLANRMALIVKNDFQNTLKSGTDFTSENVKKILYATGDAAFEKMRQMSSGNPKDIMMDLNNAQMTHKENLTAIEMMLKDHFLATISFTKMVSQGISPNDEDVNRDSFRRAWKDYWKEYPIGSRNILGIALEAIIKPFDFYFSHYRGNNDRYPKARTTTFGNNKMGAAVDNENDAAKHMYEFYCVQSLAFSDWAPFQKLCKNAVLKSPFNAAALTPAAQQKFNTLLNVSYDTKLAEHLPQETRNNIERIRKQMKYVALDNRATPDYRAKMDQIRLEMAKNHSARICALRDYGRNNFVMYLTLGTKK